MVSDPYSQSAGKLNRDSGCYERMEFWVQLVSTIACSVLASSGLWTIIQKRVDKKDANKDLLIGIAHDRIMFLAMSYIARGYITRDEYENLYNYLYNPYKKAGGNGSADHIMKQVDKLPMGKGEDDVLADLK